MPNFIAHNWEEYISQGEPYRMLKTWWEANAPKLPGSFNSSYESWEKWYSEKYFGEWGRSHTHPKEALKILKSEISEPDMGIKSRIVERKQKVERDFLSGMPTSDGASTYGRLIGKSPGANVQDVTQGVKDFLFVIGTLANKMNLKKPHVTSGYRSPKAQVRAMAKNWKRKGGANPVNESALDQDYIKKIREYTRKPLNQGLIYLFNLYKNKRFAIEINDIFVSIGIKRDGQKAAAEYIETNGEFGSSHMRNPSPAIDLRKTEGLSQILDKVQQSGRFSLKIIDEGDHFHVKIK